MVARRLRAPLLGILLLVAGPAAEAGDGAGRGAAGHLVVRGDAVLSASNADQLFVPASVSKILTVTLALHHLGPEYRVRTRLQAAAPIAGGVLAGALFLRAAGDPTWNERFHPEGGRTPLRLLARQLAARGIERIEGDLVVVTADFPGRSLPLSRSLADLPFAFAAPASALAIDENRVRVRIAPGGQVGAAGRAESLSEGLELEQEIRTVGAERHGRGTVDFLPDRRRGAVWIRGEYPISEPPYTVELAVPAPELYAARALARTLVAEGIALTGRARFASAAEASPQARTLAEHRSPPLAELLPVILEESHNWYAEMLLRLVAREVRGEGRSDEGLALASELLEREVGVAADCFVLDDASGLSPYNLMTPAAIVKLLAWARGRPWGGIFVRALARPGRGTLEVWPSLPRSAAAKSGTLRHALGLAGYLSPEAEEPVVFAYLFQTRPEERSGLRRWISRELERWVPLSSDRAR